MSTNTKNTMKDSLKKIIQKKPLNKITISDITNDCNISRMTFYYHFKDKEDLVNWIYTRYGTRGIRNASEITADISKK